METIKFFSVVVTVITVNLNLSVVESGNQLNREAEPPAGSSLGLHIPGNEELCVPIPISIFTKIRK